MKLATLLSICLYHRFGLNHLALLTVLNIHPRKFFTIAILNTCTGINPKTIPRILAQLLQVNLITIQPGTKGGAFPKPHLFRASVHEKYSPEQHRVERRKLISLKQFIA
jgi:hypothetical protein